MEKAQKTILKAAAPLFLSILLFGYAQIFLADSDMAAKTPVLPDDMALQCENDDFPDDSISSQPEKVTEETEVFNVGLGRDCLGFVETSPGNAYFTEVLLLNPPKGPPSAFLAA